MFKKRHKPTFDHIIGAYCVRVNQQLILYFVFVFNECVIRYTGREYTAESYLASHGIGPVTGYGVSILLFYKHSYRYVYIRI